VEVNEVDSRFNLFYVFYIIHPCGFIDQLPLYRLKKNNGNINKMFVLGAKHVIIHSIFYEQEVTESF
jgi:hypothetical protein